jgi:hypothetical protein
LAQQRPSRLAKTSAALLWIHNCHVWTPLAISHLEKRNIFEVGIEQSELVGPAGKISFCALRIFGGKTLCHSRLRHEIEFPAARQEAVSLALNYCIVQLPVNPC